MTAFAVPPSRMFPTDLPPAIRTSDVNSFAHFTLKERVPGILRESLGLNGFPEDIRRALEDLHLELTEGVTREVREEAPDRAFWNAVSAPHIGRSWLDVPWYWAEAYFYRRLLEATRYFQPGPWQWVDPFGPKKEAELSPEAAPAAAKALLTRLADEPKANFELLLHASLWGNRIDLSYEVATSLGRPDGEREERGNLLVDDTATLWDYLRTRSLRRIAILTDNAGTELLMDLLLADYLLGQNLAAAVYLHLKPHPFFVSDAMFRDVFAGLKALEKTDEMTRALAQRLRRQLAQNRLCLFTHWHYGTCLFYFQLPDELHSTLGGMDLVVVKGDANYRRLLGDAHWPPTTSFARVTGYFPAPVVALRTLKAEIIVGLRPGAAEELQAEDPAWLVNGRRGVVQLRI